MVLAQEVIPKSITADTVVARLGTKVKKEADKGGEAANEGPCTLTATCRVCAQAAKKKH